MGEEGRQGHFHVRLVGDMPIFRSSISCKNFRMYSTGCKISVKVPEQANQRPVIFHNRPNFFKNVCFDKYSRKGIFFILTFAKQVCLFLNIFLEKGKMPVNPTGFCLDVLKQFLVGRMKLSDYYYNYIGHHLK